MEIEIKKSTKPVEYKEAIDFLEKRLLQINEKKVLFAINDENINNKYK